MSERTAHPRVAFYGDDFTGSVDALLQFSRRGWKARLFVGLPSQRLLDEAAASSDAVGIAGIARSLPTHALDHELTPVFEALAALQPRVLQYKACSTADSSPKIGSLGRVIELGRRAVPTHTVPVLFAQPDFGRYTAFGHHFAAENGVVYRLDRQPTMSTHPSTPMDESDLAVHLGRQTELPIAGIPFTAYATATAIADHIRHTDAAAVVLDAIDDTQLTMIGEALLQLPEPLFALGSGGLSHAIAAAWPAPGDVRPQTAIAGGPILAVSGSRSAQTRRQVQAAADAGWLVRPLPTSAWPVPGVLADVTSALQSGRSVVLASDGVETAATGETITLESIAARAAEFVSAAANSGASRRIVVCGGDTSSRVTSLLGVDSLSIAANPWANIVVLHAHSSDQAMDGLELVLKGGQVGDDDFLLRLEALSSPRA
ncbi:four-carbon acid sugar kinase family protein [Humibacter sp. RRB41]|uniref:four-carbon acid sugar kinase family protein n=1 Tax=Humibacter sp. RRB41 TaxID=2919946 RepID=UPI001FAA772F|nr:four-carbon acid sugar kinase family protein [Humibacter sp. RRB41]